MSESSTVENARFLMALAGPDGRALFHDEDDHTVHELDNGVLVIATGFADGTTYTLTLADAGPDSTLDVEVERLDDRQAGHKATLVACAVDADDEQDLAERLERLAGPARSAQASRAATEDEAASLASMLVDAGEWEWKDWPENGTDFLQRGLDKMETGIVLARPAHKDIRKVFSSKDFTKAMLQWFRRQLEPHGWTFVALSPFGEYQAFALVREGHLDRVQALLQLQGRRTR
jgi:hypothetical protein